MKLNEYQKAAVELAIYPTPLVYPALGLCGEIGELTKEKLAESDNVSKEIGDVLWYVANVASDMGMRLSEVCGRKTFPKKSVDYWSVDDVLEELAIRCGEVAENVKKTLRDDDGVLGERRRGNIATALKEIVVLLENSASHQKITLQDCADENIKKLQSRQKRGKIGGDGNNR